MGLLGGIGGYRSLKTWDANHNLGNTLFGCGCRVCVFVGGHTHLLRTDGGGEKTPGRDMPCDPGVLNQTRNRRRTILEYSETAHWPPPPYVRFLVDF